MPLVEVSEVSEVLPRENPPAGSPPVLPLPLLFRASPSSDADLGFAAALADAVAVCDAAPDPRNTRRRIALLVCELAAQYGRRTGDWSLPLPISRDELARAAGLGLFSVKRALALLELTGVVDRRPDGLRITDWPRLLEVAHYPVERLGFVLPREEGPSELPYKAVPTEHLRTLGGDPAYFE